MKQCAINWPPTVPPWVRSSTFVPDYGISAAISAHLTQTRRKKSHALDSLSVRCLSSYLIFFAHFLVTKVRMPSGVSGGLLFGAPFLLPLHEIGKFGGAREIELPSVASSCSADPRPDGISDVGVYWSLCSRIWQQNLAVA